MGRQGVVVVEQRRQTLAASLPGKKCLGGLSTHGLAGGQERGREPSCIFLAGENDSVFLQASQRYSENELDRQFAADGWLLAMTKEVK